MNEKYVNGMPLDRIATDLRRNDVNISKQVMANWVIRCSERYLSPVYFRLHELLLTSDVIQQDETPVEVTKDGRPANSKSFMWVYRSGKYHTDRVIILYEYQKTRKAEHPQKFLEGFHGICECDAYAVYEKMDRETPDITFAFCHAHARRYFAEALKAIPKEQRDKAKGTVAHEALEQIAGIYHMDNQQLNRYVGDYDKFQEVYAVKKAQLEAAYRRQQQEISELKDFVARNKARVSTRNMAMSRQKKLDKMDVIELAAEKPKPEFHFRYGRTPGKMLFETHDLVTGYDEPLSKPLNFSMERGQKIALVGTNGIGKTTLLKSILGLIPSLSGSCELGENLEIGYFEQEVKGENKTTCIDEIWQEFPSFTQYEVRSALAKCGLTTKHIESQVRVLSGGEQAKVRLCKLINRDTNILLLDEPTNHLDVDAKDSLKKALQEYRGSILLICHEPEFYQDVVNEVWDMSKWTTKVF